MNTVFSMNIYFCYKCFCQELETTCLESMKVVKNLFLVLVLLYLFFAGVGSSEFNSTKSKQRLLNEITQNLADKDVECLNYFTEKTGETFWFNIPAVYMSLRLKKSEIVTKCLRGCHERYDLQQQGL